MLEIIVVISMCRFLHKKATDKGWPGWPFVLTMIIGWLAFALGGLILGIILSGDDGEFPIGGVIGYLIGAVIACVSNTMVVTMLPNRKTETEDDDYTDRRRRRRRYEDDDDDDRRDRQDREGRRRYDRDDDRDDRRDNRDDDRDWRPKRYSDDR